MWEACLGVGTQSVQHYFSAHNLFQFEKARALIEPIQKEFPQTQAAKMCVTPLMLIALCF
jgi:hypothetical protein